MAFQYLIGSKTRSYIEFDVSYNPSALYVGDVIRVNGNVREYNKSIQRFNIQYRKYGELSGIDVCGVDLPGGSNKVYSFDLSFEITPELIQLLDTSANDIVSVEMFFGVDCTSSAASYPSGIVTTIVKQRTAPRIMTMKVEDANGYYNKFVHYIQNESELVVSCTAFFDEYDSKPNPIYTAQALNSNGDVVATWESHDSTLNIGKLSDPFVSRILIVATDRYGLSDQRYADIEVLPYTPPELFVLPHEGKNVLAERWGYDLDLNEVPLDDGERIRLFFGVDVCPVNDRNAWNIAIDIVGSNNTSFSAEIDSGLDGSYNIMEYLYYKVGGSILFSPSVDYDIAVTVTDYFGNKSFQTFTVIKSGGYANIEKFGVAVGMRCQGSLTDKRFEVAEDYTSYFYGGISGVTDYSADEVRTGGKWLDGSPIYVKTLNAGTVNVSSGNNNYVVSNFDAYKEVIGITGRCKVGDNWVVLPSNFIGLQATPNGIAISTSASTSMTLQNTVLTITYLRDEEIVAPEEPDIPDTPEFDGEPVEIAPSGYSSSTNYSSSYPASKLFDGSVSSGWISTAGDADPAVTIALPGAYKNISVAVYGYKRSNGGAPSAVTGYVNTSNSTSGAVSKSIDTNASSVDGSLLGVLTFENTTPCSNVMLHFAKGNHSFVAVGEIKIMGIPA